MSQAAKKEAPFVYDEQLIREHMPLVKRITLHLMGKMPSGIEADDLMQAGMMGLLAAAKDYSPDHGASFSTYAGIRIKGSILDEVRHLSWTPRSVQKKSKMLSQAVRAVEAQTGEAATDRALAEELGVELDEYHQMAREVSSGQLIYVDEEEAFENGSDFLEKEMEDDDLKLAIRNSIDHLPEREKLFMALYYQEELNLKEIGEILGVSESRACQIHGQALSRIRARMQEWTTY